MKKGVGANLIGGGEEHAEGLDGLEVRRVAGHARTLQEPGGRARGGGRRTSERVQRPYFWGGKPQIFGGGEKAVSQVAHGDRCRDDSRAMIDEPCGGGSALGGHNGCLDDKLG